MTMSTHVSIAEYRLNILSMLIGTDHWPSVILAPLAQSTPQPSRAPRHRSVADADGPFAIGSEGTPIAFYS